MDRQNKRPDIWAFVALVFLTLGWATPALAATKGQIVIEEFAFWADGNTLNVMQLAVGHSGNTFALLPGAKDVSVPGGATAVVLNGSMAIPTGSGQAEVEYQLPLTAHGLSVLLPVLTPTHMVFVLVSDGVNFPIVLNQAFFEEGTSTSPSVGKTFSVYVAQDPKGSFRLNLEPAPPGPAASLEWLWLLLFVPIAIYLTTRVTRRHA